MTLKDIKENNVRIPVWLITLLVPVFVSLSGFSIYQVRTQERILNTLENHSEIIQKLEKTVEEKAAKTELLDQKSHLIRIEDKLDRLIERLSR